MQFQPPSGTQSTSPPPSNEWPPAWSGQPRRRNRGVVFPLLFVIVGVVLLLNNLGYLPWSIWTALGQLWPVLLILFGLDLLIGRRNAWLGAFVTLIAFAAVLVAALWLTYRSPAVSAASVPTNVTAIAVPLDGATTGMLTLRFGAGDLTVGALPAGATDLARGSASLPNGVRLTQIATPSNGTADATIATEGDGSIGWPFPGFSQGSKGPTLDLDVNPATPLTLRADVGAGQSDFDLSKLAVESFTLNNGAGQATIHFPAQAGQVSADIHSGAGQVVLDVPPGVGAYIHGNNGLVSVHVPTDRFQKVSDGYQTTDYASAANRVDVTLSLGIGEVDVR